MARPTSLESVSFADLKAMHDFTKQELLSLRDPAIQYSMEIKVKVRKRLDEITNEMYVRLYGKNIHEKSATLEGTKPESVDLSKFDTTETK